MLSGVILAGGPSRRMQSVEKGLLPINQENLVQRQIRLMKEVCSEIILVTNSPRKYLPVLGSSVRIITDYISGNGPLCGMHAAFSLCKNDLLWVVGCDMPFISPKAVQVMLEKHRTNLWDVIIPFIHNKYHMLHGIYRKQVLRSISSCIEQEEYDCEQLLRLLHIRSIDESSFLAEGVDNSFVESINTKEDYIRITDMLQSVPH
ncbi:molybdenum cofactor guanylyltransferase [Paenibacillus larvae]